MKEIIGKDETGAPVHRITLRREGMRAAVLSHGAILQDLRIAGHERSLVLGYSDLQGYLSDQNYFGAMVGRVANRIGGGLALLDGQSLQLDRNLPDGHHLHGGSEGSGRRNWRVVDHSETHVTLEDTLPDGHMGYPGNLTVQVHFSLLEGQTLSVDITAQCDALTLCNFAHHSYFNLGYAETITGHSLEVAADSYVAVSAAGIPTGELRRVTGTAFDFRAGRRLMSGERYDHNLCLADQRRGLQKVASLCCPEGRTQLEISTTEAGLQIYTGHGIKAAYDGMDRVRYGPFSGIALEPQGWPDAPNHADFPSVTLAVGETYHQKSTFRFVHPAR
ncbi:aldose epimerase family protein [uncultured Sulfitobacter sp.]|uniref:aldose epimerase family protein n=1 Tax=uncultured Sulfitobacter sp. TaxID=191468 RepID=UPI00262D8DD3|nr:aldose epimerase family protein [uncultured Sulfitobacter sp.]